jgi:hypothetical protein
MKDQRNWGHSPQLAAHIMHQRSKMNALENSAPARWLNQFP